MGRGRRKFYSPHRIEIVSVVWGSSFIDVMICFQRLVSVRWSAPGGCRSGGCQCNQSLANDPPPCRSHLTHPLYPETLKIPCPLSHTTLFGAACVLRPFTACLYTPCR